MKILQVIQKAQLRGAEIFAMQLSMELLKKGVTVDCVYLFDGRDELIKMFPELKFRWLGARSARRLLDFAAYRRLAKWIHEGQYDIVQANAGDTLKYASISKMLHGWDATLIFRNANTMSGFIRGFLHKSLNKFLLMKCQHIISVSESCRRDLVSLFPFTADRSSTITIGTYVGQTPEAQAPAEPVFLNIAALVREKNHEFLLDTFSAYYEKHHKGELWIIGSGPLKETLEASAQRLGISKRVSFLGHQSDVKSFLNKSSLMIMPSKIEGLPAVLLEAMANRVPVIASAVGGIPEVVVDGINGFCISGYDVATYVNKMEVVVNDDPVRIAFISAAYDLVERKFRIDRIANEFLEKYQAILSSRA